MMRLPGVLGLAGILGFAGGCFPLFATVRFPQTGQVLESDTGRPIPGAKVTVESWQVQTPPGPWSRRELLHIIEVETNAEGQWTVPGERDWKLAILAADGFPYFRQSACVSAPGFQVAVFSPFLKDALTSAKNPPTTISLRRGIPAPRASRGEASSPCGIPLQSRE